MTANTEISREKVWDLIDKAGFCMLVTSSNSGLRARPMSAIVDEASNCIRFIADMRQAKDDEIAADADVCLTFSDAGKGIFVSVTGTGRIERDRAQVHKYWTAMGDVWFEQGKDDPNAILIEITPRIAEYWETPGLLMSSVELLKSQISGEKPDLGNNETVHM